MNNDSFLIEEFDLDYAKNICKLIENPDIRNKAVANVAAASFAKKYFQDCEVDTESGLHNVCQVLENIDISDIYIKDNYIDVRLYFNDNELFVPKSHFDNNLLPVAYMFIKVGSDLSNGLVTGFITPSSVDTSIEYNGFYHVNEDELISFYDVESNLINKYEEDLPDNFENLVFDYLDNKLTEPSDFYKILIDSKEAREKLQKAAKAKIVFNFVSVPNVQDTSVDETEEVVLDTEPDELLEVSDNSGLGLDEPMIEEFEGIEEIAPLDLEEANELSLDNSDSMILNVEDDLVPFEEETQELETSDVSIEENDEPEIEEPESLEMSEESAIKLNEDFDTDSIQMLGAGVYEEQSFNDAIEDAPVLTENEEEEFTINMLDSSKINFDEPTVPETVEEIQELELEIKEEEENNDTQVLDIIEETEVEEPVTEIEETVETAEPEDFDFSTNVTPSLDTFEEEVQEEEIVTELTEELLEENHEAEQEEDIQEEENAEQIDTLFNADEEETEQEAIETVVKQKSKNMVLPVVGVIALLAVLGYYSYTKFMIPQQAGNDIVDNTQNTVQSPEITEPVTPVEDAMPVETVENVKVQLNTNEGNAISIPAIEQNLDASITVSNLRVEFEIPAGYKSSKTAERYFTKMGKIIQLNLKTELLLLTKQPITNKIAVELEYNKNAKKFDVKGLLASSGETTIDDLILRTVKNALNINLNMNTNVFGSVSGNPVLVIKL